MPGIRDEEACGGTGARGKGVKSTEAGGTGAQMTARGGVMARRPAVALGPKREEAGANWRRDGRSEV